MSNSPLVSFTRISPNSTNPRNHAIDTITIHHCAGVCTAESIAAIFAPVERQASCNYGIGNDGKIALVVDEANRSWCSSSRDNDHRAITIEVSNSATGGDWPVSEKAMSALINLCVDICKRNGIARLNYTGNTSGNLTMHKWFAATACPGPYLESRFGWIAEQVNAQLGASVKTSSFNVGDEVKLVPGATYTSGDAIPSWVFASTLYVREVQGSNIVISVLQSGAITGVVAATNLVKVNENVAVQPSTPSQNQTVVSNTFHVGDKVKIVAGAKYYNGVAIPSWVMNQNWYVASIDGDMIIIDKNEAGTNSIFSPIHDYNLTLVAPATPVCSHSKYNIVGEKSATCTAEGYTGDKICASCGEKLEVGKTIAKRNHRPGQIAATCTSGQVCVDCGEVLVKELGHHYVNVVVDPTCTERGYTKHTCSRCGYSYIDSYVNANGHVPGNVADCTHDQNCTVCGTKLVDKLGHNYEDVLVFPTCTDKGYTKHKCSRCGESYVDTYIDALGHDYILTGKKEPTVEEEGYTGDMVCSRCNDTLKGDVISKLPAPEPVVPESQPSETEEHESISQKIVKILKWLLSLFTK